MLSLSTEVFINKFTCQSSVEAQALRGIPQEMKTPNINLNNFTRKYPRMKKKLTISPKNVNQ